MDNIAFLQEAEHLEFDKLHVASGATALGSVTARGST